MGDKYLDPVYFDKKNQKPSTSPGVLAEQRVDVHFTSEELKAKGVRSNEPFYLECMVTLPPDHGIWKPSLDDTKKPAAFAPHAIDGDSVPVSILPDVYDKTRERNSEGWFIVGATYDDTAYKDAFVIIVGVKILFYAK